MLEVVFNTICMKTPTLFILLTLNTYAQDSIIIQKKEENQQVLAQKKWNLNLSGFIQADIIVDNKKLNYIDGYYPTAMESNKTDYNTYFTMRQSQLALGITNNETGLKGFIEVDFIGSNNTNNIRLRKLYITYKNWLIGQDWSTINDLNTSPNLLDFNGPNAALYKRRPQIRYLKRVNDKNEYSFALEDPNIPSITVDNELGWKKKTLFPNLIATYKYGNKTYIRGAAVLSPISYNKRNTPDEKLKTNTTLGYGLYATSVIFTNKLSRFKLVAAVGSGTATNIISFDEAGYDAIIDKNNPTSLKKLNYFSGVAAYEHWWNEKWSSVVFYSGSFIGNEKYSEKNNLKSVQHLAINTIYQPTSFFKTGIEVTYGFVDRYEVTNKTESARVQMSAVFSF